MYFLIVQETLNDSDPAIEVFSTLHAAKNYAEDEYDENNFTFTILRQDRYGLFTQLIQAEQAPKSLNWEE